jgi:hypothetical protein
MGTCDLGREPPGARGLGRLATGVERPAPRTIYPASGLRAHGSAAFYSLLLESRPAGPAARPPAPSGYGQAAHVAQTYHVTYVCCVLTGLSGIH